MWKIQFAKLHYSSITGSHFYWFLFLLYFAYSNSNLLLLFFTSTMSTVKLFVQRFLSDDFNGRTLPAQSVAFNALLCGEFKWFPFNQSSRLEILSCVFYFFYIFLLNLRLRFISLSASFSVSDSFRYSSFSSQPSFILLEIKGLFNNF